MVIEAAYDKRRNYDIIFEKVILTIKKSIKEKNDDYLLLYTGDTGTGKSSLMLHGYELFDPEGCSMEYIGLDSQTHATALKKAKEKPHPRFCGDDEANVSRRNAMTKYNKDKIDLYLAIRGLNVFHAWCNPSAEQLDKAFIEERIKGMIFVINKDIKRPRVYYFFRKDDLLKLYEKHSNLKMRTLKQHGKQFAYYKGWFRKYEGKLLEEYEIKKGSRMNFKVDDFFEKYSEGRKGATAGSKELGVDPSTFRKWYKELIEAGLLLEDKDYVIKTSGRKEFTKDGLEKIKNKRKLMAEHESSFSGNPLNLPNNNIPAFDTPKEVGDWSLYIKILVVGFLN